MIPKTLIHCNFGNMEFRPNIEQRCIKSWEIYFPKDEWNWVELNESTYDVSKNFYTKNAYEKGLYNLVSDYARLDYLYKNGGVYVDTDLLMLKSLDENILENNMFIGNAINHSYLINYMKNEYLSWGIFGAIKNNNYIKKILDDFDKVNNINDINNINLIAIKNSIEILKSEEKVDVNNINNKYRFVECENLTIYPFDYFTCNYYYNPEYVNITDNSYSIHLYGCSWNNKFNKKNINSKIEKIEEYLHDTKNTDLL